MAAETDLVLIYLEDHPLTYARIEAILADAKPDWYHVKLLMLQVPPQIVTWILKDVYIDGTEFTMNGKRMRLERVVVPQEPQSEAKNTKSKEENASEQKKGTGKVISLADLKKK